MFKAPDKKQLSRALADLYPEGLAWNSKNSNNNFNKFINGVSCEFLRQLQTLEDVANSYTPILENLNRGTFLADWLRSYLIPDECLKSLSNNADIILYLLAKVSGLTVFSDKQSYIDLAIFFGATLVISYPAPHTIIFDVTVPGEGGFPFTFPFPFGGELGIVIKCIYEQSVPVHIDLTVNLIEM